MSSSPVIDVVYYYSYGTTILYTSVILRFIDDIIVQGGGSNAADHAIYHIQTI